MKTIAIIGADGQLGSSLQRVDWQDILGRDDCEVVTADRPEVDLTEPDTIAQFLDRHRVDTLIDCAAWTDVEGAEDHPDECRAVNVQGTAALAGACADRETQLVYISTDYVFDGDKGAPYAEDDPTGGLNVYARSKADGERAVMESPVRSLVVRSSWLFGPGGRNFVESILRQGRLRDRLTVVCDQTGCPTGTDDFAEAIYRLVALETDGIVHFSNAGTCTWYEFACEIVRQAGIDVEMIPVATAEMLGFKARRPTYSVLDTSRYTALTEQAPRSWQAALADYLASRK